MSTNHFQGYALFKLFIYIPDEATLLKYSPKDGVEEAQSVTVSAVQSVSFAGKLIVDSQRTAFAGKKSLASFQTKALEAV